MGGTFKYLSNFPINKGVVVWLDIRLREVVGVVFL